MYKIMIYPSIFMLEVNISKEKVSKIFYNEDFLHSNNLTSNVCFDSSAFIIKLTFLSSYRFL